VISNTLQGIVIQSMAASNIITGNLVSGNGADGILIHDGGTNFNVVSNNAVGTNYAGTEALANQYSGVAIINGPYSTLVGGPTLGDRNYISGNGTYGVYIAGASTINTYAAVPNGAAGVAILAAQDTVLDQDQYISGNARQGIYTDAANNTRIAASNRIGLASDGLSPMGNGLQGIVLNNTTNTHVVAIVRYNGATGIAVTGASANNNRVQPYIDRDNGRLPIDLNADGFTPNDPGDTDSGPNGLLNYPVITATSSSVISGTACANCTVLVYWRFGDPTANGGGAQFTGGTGVADGAGDFTLTLPFGLTAPQITLQTCQSPCSLYSNTSELSPVYVLPFRTFLPLVLK
jgi:hypothetical protein